MYRALNRMQLCKWIPVPWQQYWDEVYQLLLLITLRGTYSILLYFISDQLFIVVKTLYICWMPNARKFSEVTPANCMVYSKGFVGYVNFFAQLIE